MKAKLDNRFLFVSFQVLNYMCLVNSPPKETFDVPAKNYSQILNYEASKMEIMEEEKRLMGSTLVKFSITMRRNGNYGNGKLGQLIFCR